MEISMDRLTKYSGLKSLKKKKEQELEKLKNSAWSSTVQTSAPYPSFAKTYIKVDGCDGQRKEATSALRDKISHIEEEMYFIEAFVAFIEDPVAKEIFTDYILNDERLVDIAVKFGYSGKSGVYNVMKRYLSKNL